MWFPEGPCIPKKLTVKSLEMLAILLTKLKLIMYKLQNKLKLKGSFESTH